MSRRPPWNPRCGECGLFFSWRADYGCYTPWGRYNDLDPPDPVPVCPDCEARMLEKTLDRMRTKGLHPYRARRQWVPHRVRRMAAGIVRGEWKHGLRERPTVHARVREEWQSGRKREWCACGWDTGWHDKGSLWSATNPMTMHVDWHRGTRWHPDLYGQYQTLVDGEWLDTDPITGAMLTEAVDETLQRA